MVLLPVLPHLFGARKALDPRSIPGLALYLRADRGITLDASGNVETWADQSGNGNNVTQATAAQRPSYVSGAFGGKAGVAFDGTDDLLTSASVFLTGSSGLVMGLLRHTGDSVGNATLLGSSDTASATRYCFMSAKVSAANPSVRLLVRDDATFNNTGEGPTDLEDNRDYIIAFRSSGSAYQLRIDGAIEPITMDSGADDGKWFADVTARDNVTVGALTRSDGDLTHLTGRIGVLLVYEPDILDHEVAKLERALRAWPRGGLR